MEMQLTKYTVNELLDLRKNKMLTVNSEYQRGAVWDEDQQKKLIDSILRGYPLPLIYLHHIKTSVAGMQREDLEVIDGQQRINAMYEFREGALKLFHPVRDEKTARFPEFIKSMPCSWGGLDFNNLSADDKATFLNTELPIVRIVTDNVHEARDLFIRLQAGLPLNSQEKRDAWPGGFTEFILRTAGKHGIAKFRGHDFFRKCVATSTGTDRGKTRQLCAQMYMLFSARRSSSVAQLTSIYSRAVDEFYYKNLDFEPEGTESKRFVNVLDKLLQLLGDGKRRRLKGHEAIHAMLLTDSLLDDYTRSWEGTFVPAFDKFLERLVEDKKTKKDENPGEFWKYYDQWTRTNSDRAEMITVRHLFFVKKMTEFMGPLCLKDPNRFFGDIEREQIYFRDNKKCAVCGADVTWADHEIHHLRAHTDGGPTTLANGKLVHKHCHPKGGAAVSFAASVSG